jgi:hypothetical protein
VELLMEIKSKERTELNPEYCFTSLHGGWWKEIPPAARQQRDRQDRHWHGRVNNNPGWGWGCHAFKFLQIKGQTTSQQNWWCFADQILEFEPPPPPIKFSCFPLVSISIFLPNHSATHTHPHIIGCKFLFIFISFNRSFIHIPPSP